MSNNAKSELSTKVQNLLRLYMVQDRQSKAHYEHQNPIERRVQDVKRMTSTTMDRTGCPAKFWLLCLLYVVALLNVLDRRKLKREKNSKEEGDQSSPTPVDSP